MTARKVAEAFKERYREALYSGFVAPEMISDFRVSRHVGFHGRLVILLERAGEDAGLRSVPELHLRTSRPLVKPSKRDVAGDPKNQFAFPVDVVFETAVEQPVGIAEVSTAEEIHEAIRLDERACHLAGELGLFTVMVVALAQRITIPPPWIIETLNDWSSLDDKARRSLLDASVKRYVSEWARLSDDLRAILGDGAITLRLTESGIEEI